MHANFDRGNNMYLSNGIIMCNTDDWFIISCTEIINQIITMSLLENDYIMPSCPLLLHVSCLQLLYIAIQK